MTNRSNDAPVSHIINVTETSTQIDNVFRLLSDRRRRFCLYYLLRADGPTAIRELAAMVEASVTPPGHEVTDRAIEETHLLLTHNHLPKLRDEGIIDVTDGAVQLQPSSALPVKEWLATTAAVELRPAERAALCGPVP